MRPSPLTVRPLLALLLLQPLALFAQPLGTPASLPPSLSGAPWTERGSLRLRYGAAMHRGSYVDVGPGLTYRGLAPNDFGVGGEWFFQSWLGVRLGLEREGYGLYEAQTPVSAGQFLRAQLGPLARYRAGPFRLEAGAGYTYVQLPSFIDSLSGRLADGVRHAALLSASGRLYLHRNVGVQLGAELPLTLQARDGAGGKARSSGYAVGGGLWLALRRTSIFGVGALLDYQFAHDRMESDSGGVGDRRLHRFGMSIELAWLEPLPAVAWVEPRGEPTPPTSEPPPAPTPGALVLRVTNLATGEPVPGAVVTVGTQEVQTDAQGQARVEGLAAGPAAVSVRAEGFAPGSAVASMAEGLESSVALALTPEGKKIPAMLSGTVRSRASGTPVRAELEIPQAKLRLTTEVNGTFTVTVPEGTYAIFIRAPGYRAQSKRLTLREGEQAILNVDLATDSPK